MSWSALTHRLNKEWKDLDLEGRSILVLFSGGGDSTAALSVAHALSASHGYRVFAGHVHHGPGENRDFRDRALDFCREFCEARGIPLLEEKAKGRLRSEAELREFRRAAALGWAKNRQIDRLLVAHHARDLLETRFFRLLRGTGPQGLIAMRPWVAPWWRPLLNVSKSEIEAHLVWEKLRFLADPSNASRGPTRNWIRNDIFPRIEGRRPGSLDRLASSLENLAEAVAEETLFWETPFEDGISRAWLLTLSASRQKRALAQYLWSLGQRNFRHTQLEEIRKRLDNPQIDHRLTLAGCDWVLNAERVRAFPRQKAL